MNAPSALKERAWQAIRDRRAVLVELAERIRLNPEVGYTEHQASTWLAELLQKEGFAVQKPWGGLETSFRAQAGAGSPAVYFLAEYDALPGVGHGCGHNLIASLALGALLGAAAVVPHTGGTIGIIGTPAEEYFGEEEGKVKLLRAGGFAGVDVALMAHPSHENRVLGGDLGFVAFDVEFYGKPAHASADPWNGINALDALLAMFHHIGALRQQLEPSVRIHGIITDGGQAPNIIPVRAAARFMVRAPHPGLLEQVYERVKDCARAGALATGAELKLVHNTTFFNSRIIPTLNRLAAENGALVNLPIDPEPLRMQASSDFGNVTQAMPAAMIMVRTHPAGIPWHSTQVAQASAEPLALDGLISSACLLAGMAVDLLENPALAAAARKEYQQA
jgi:amidohydrolase